MSRELLQDLDLPSPFMNRFLSVMHSMPLHCRILSLVEHATRLLKHALPSVLDLGQGGLLHCNLQFRTRSRTSRASTPWSTKNVEFECLPAPHHDVFNLLVPNGSSVTTFENLAEGNITCLIEVYVRSLFPNSSWPLIYLPPASPRVPRRT